MVQQIPYGVQEPPESLAYSLNISLVKRLHVGDNRTPTYQSCGINAQGSARRCSFDGPQYKAPPGDKAPRRDVYGPRYLILVLLQHHCARRRRILR